MAIPISHYQCPDSQSVDLQYRVKIIVKENVVPILKGSKEDMPSVQIEL